jgi:hypothetical protein
MSGTGIWAVQDNLLSLAGAAKRAGKHARRAEAKRVIGNG